ncbi:protein of unknown function [Catalinimonas alkaloidigena]|uniref:DUF4290 domain-containing protein n=1 Tax=Catalinimonas alkaloidigena TaxID=1075417 RepID=A0A1G9NDG2_9BACT|nr:DUF4290 domain-containing protein [Catalinimonas alkaloidigena]SDL84492.1 protein of unknown function [Catalinimonas alkaloidigena]
MPERENLFYYYTEDEDIILKEYGRNVQRLVQHVMSIPDREERTQSAIVLVDLMRQLNPNFQNTQDYHQKLWDDLYIMSNFELDVDGPYPKPEPAIIHKKPQRMRYREGEVRYKHYGRNLELLVQRAVDLEDPEEREAAIIYLGKLMKSFYSTWNKENIEDEVIIQQLRDVSRGKLTIPIERVKAQNLFDSQPVRDYPGSSSNNNTSNSSNRGSRNYRSNRRQGGRRR